jgi:hypothetical protein
LGNYYRLKATLRDTGYVYLVSYDRERGMVSRLFPYSPASSKDNYRSAGLFYFPGLEDSFGFQATGWSGENWIKLFVTRRPLAMKFTGNLEADAYMARDQTRDLVAALKKLSPDDWSAAPLMIYIRE